MGDGMFVYLFFVCSPLYYPEFPQRSWCIVIHNYLFISLKKKKITEFSKNADHFLFEFLFSLSCFIDFV